MDMMAMLLARAMAGGGNGGSGGGGLGGADWNAAEGEPGHVLNRTHYEENAEVEFFPETTLVGEGGQFAIEGELPFVIDQTYAVYFNGTRYECKCYSITYEGIVMTGVGNSAILGMPGAVDTGEPFTVGVVPAMQPGVTLVIDYAGGATCTLAISAVEKVVHQLPNKYIKDMYGEEVKEVNITFDGDTSDKEIGSSFFGQKMVKVSNLMPTIDELKAASYSIYGVNTGETQTETMEEWAKSNGYTVDEFVEQPEGVPVVFVGNGYISVCYEPYSNENMSLTPGVYFISVKTNELGISTDAYISNLTYIETKIRHLNPKYIKDMYHEDNTEEEILPKTTLDGNGSPFAIIDCDCSFLLTEGKAVTVEWNGTAYASTVKLSNNMPYLGNIALGGGEDNTGEPFLLTPMYDDIDEEFFYTQLHVIGSEPLDGHTLRIYTGTKTIHKIPEKYLPDTVQKVGGDVFLASPNGTKYKLVVADDGTLSTEAVT